MKYLKISILLTVLLALGAGSAEAQECAARTSGDAVTARAEGITEKVGKIQLKCRIRPSGSSGFGFDNDPITGATKLKIAVKLNTAITNTVDSDDEVLSNGTTSAGYDGGGIGLDFEQLTTGIGNGTDLGGIDETATGDNAIKGKVSGNTITWEFTSTQLRLAANDEGFQVTIAGLRADASARGDASDITAEVMFNGTAVGSPIKVADVKTGMKATVTAVKGVQCKPSGSMSMKGSITITEGFADGFMVDYHSTADSDNNITVRTREKGDSVVVSFKDVPEGVNVSVPRTVAVDADAEKPANGGTAGETISLMLDAKGSESMYKVSLTNGAGAVTYKISDAGAQVAIGSEGDDNYVAATANPKKAEWAKLPITFEWGSDGKQPDEGMAMVSATFAPVGGKKLPRFTAASSSATVLTIEDCVSTLTFPFITTRSGFHAGIAVSNPSAVDGECTVTYTGDGESGDLDTVDVAARSTWSTNLALAYTTMEDFAGQLDIECNFLDGDGYAFLIDPGSSVAQGYLPRVSTNAGGN